ncbi:hypothetical protein ONZ45_g7040 [Pleurotus djamor]|nr:hypothetical protein ONZ45_g7040 [Pleurotus djamor]
MVNHRRRPVSPDSAQSHGDLNSRTTTDVVNNVPASVEQQCIDEQISQLDARIRALKTERNTYARISRLPAEIVAEIFIFAKYASQTSGEYLNLRPRRERGWLNIAGVSTYWRKIVLNCPRFWSTITLAPEEHLEAIDPKNLFEFLRLNEGASAPILRVLILRGRISLLPKDILQRPMNSLQELRIVDGTLTFPFPPFPQLKRLFISDLSTYHASPLSLNVLLKSLSNSPNLETLRVYNVHILVDSSEDAKRSSVHLPRLTCLEIHGPRVGFAELLSSLKHPQTANITFWCQDDVPQGSDISDLQNALIEFASLPGRVIRGVSVKADYAFNIILDTVFHSSSHSLALTLHAIHSDDFTQLLSAVPFSKAASLDLTGITDVFKPSHLLGLCDDVEALKLTNCTAAVFHGLSQAKDSKLPLPKLRTLVVDRCDFYLSYLEPDTVMCDAMISLLKQRKRLNRNIEKLTIRECEIREDAVQRVRKFVKVAWDRYEIEDHDGDGKSPRVIITSRFCSVDYEQATVTMSTDDTVHNVETMEQRRIDDIPPTKTESRDVRCHGVSLERTKRLTKGIEGLTLRKCSSITIRFGGCPFSTYAEADRLRTFTQDVITVNKSNWPLTTMNADPDAVNNVRTMEQRCIDEQISQFHARIRSLKTERNTYARICQLPAEIIAEIFLHTKRAAESALVHGLGRDDASCERDWLVITGVCTRWREIALNCPRLWSTITLTPVKRALKMIERTKSAPLFISCSTLGEQGLDEISSVVMSNIHRIQKLDAGAIDSKSLFEFLRLNEGASASALQVLILRCRITPLPKDILERRMDSLQDLQIYDGTLAFPFPPFPQLKRLLINDSSGYQLNPLPIDVLLESLRNAPNLEGLRVHNVHVPADPSGDAKRSSVHLPRLTHLEIRGPSIRSSKFLSLLKHPQTANVEYSCQDDVPQGSNISDLRNALFEFAFFPGRIIRGISVSTDWNRIALDTVLDCSSHSFELNLLFASKGDFAQLLSITPFARATSLDLSGVSAAIGLLLLALSGEVEVLTLTGCTVELFQGLYTANKTKLFLPKLRTLVLNRCRFHLSYKEPNTVMCNAMVSLLQQRKRLKRGMEGLTIRHCDIREAVVDNFRKYATVDWDGREIEDEIEDADDSFSEEEDF